MSDAFEFIKQCGTFFLTTVNHHAPAARPFGAIMEHDGSLYFSTANTKDVYSQLIANPSIQIVALKAGTRDWIRVNGKATEVHDLDMKQAMLDACPVLLRHFDTKEAAAFALFKVQETDAWLHAGGKVTQL